MKPWPECLTQAEYQALDADLTRPLTDEPLQRRRWHRQPRDDYSGTVQQLEAVDNS